MSCYPLSSCNVPVECDLAVAKFLSRLRANFSDLEVVATADGYAQGTLKSASVKTDADLSRFCGTIR